MSFLDKELADFVAPIPEDLLDGKSGRARVEVEKGYRAYVRLKDQEERLRNQAYLKTASAEQYVPRPPRRVPQGQSLKHVRVAVPKVLKDLKAKTLSKDLARTQSPSPPVTAAKTPPDACIASDGEDEGQVQSMSLSPGLHHRDAWAGTTMATTCSAGGKVKVKPATLTEKIGLLYTPTANVRSAARNSKIASRSFAKSYRNTQPPPLPEPDLPETAKGLKGEDPLESHFLPLEEFDTTEQEPCTPHEWVLLGTADSSSRGTPARSKYYADAEDVEGSWRECFVKAYDENENSYFVEWARRTEGDTERGKWVKRLNLIFNLEDEEQWQERVQQATTLRNRAEADMRLELYVNGMPDELVTPINEDEVDRILALVADEFPLAHLHVIECGIGEMRDAYAAGLKRAIFNYRYMDPQERNRLHPLNLPPYVVPDEPELNALRGTVSTPSPNYAFSRRYIEENLFFTHRLLCRTICAIVGRWDTFSTSLLCDVGMHDIPLPCELDVFKTRQNVTVTKTSERLQDDWSVNTTATILNDLDDHFNFYEDDADRYRNSRMCRFFRMINLIMAFQLRSLVLDSVKAYTEFLMQYRVELPADYDEAADWISETEDDRAERERKEVFLQQREEERAIEAEERAAQEEEEKKVAAKAGGVVNDEDEAANEVVDPGTMPVVSLVALSLQTDADREHKGYHRQILETCRSVNGNRPLFVIKLISNSDAVIFDPLLEEVEDAVKGVYESFFNETQEILGVGDKLFPLLNLRPFELASVSRDELPVELVHGLMTDNKKGPRQLLALYEVFDYILKIDVDTFIEEFEATKPTLKDFESQMEQLQTDMERIQNRSLNEVCFEMIKVECYDIKRSLTRKVQDISAALHDLLAKQARTMCRKCADDYSDIFQVIQAPVETPEELHKMKLEADLVPSRVEQLQKEFSNVTDAHGLLRFHHFSIEDGDFDLYWKTFGWPQAVQQVLEDSDFKYKENRHRFINQLREDTEDLTQEVQDLQGKVDACSRWSAENQLEEYYLQVQKLRSQIDTAEEKMLKYNSRKELFNMPVAPWNLKEVATSFEPYEQLWTTVNHVSSKFELWNMRPFENLQPDEVETSVVQWGKVLSGLTRKLKDDGPLAIANKFHDQVKTFLPLLPLIHALRHPGLQQKHWKEIAGMVGMTDKNLKPSEPDKFTLKHLVQCNVLEHLHAIEEVSDRAEKQHKLDKQLSDMKAEWTHIQYQLEPHGDTFVLKEVDDIQAKLDEHIVKTQTMLGSQHARDIKDQVERWEGRLSLLQSIQDEWLKCQQSWAYLEPIFSAADIQRALPGAYQSFSKVDRVWNEVMDSTKKNPAVIIKADDEDLLRKFEKANGLLEEILKKLYDFLETKRMAFPRFYFISNDALLEILSESQEPTRVQKYLSKCFEGVKELRFRENLDIDRMISPEGETVDFVKSLNPADCNNQVELWLEKVEDTMRESIRDHLKRGLDDYITKSAEGEEGRIKWILQWPGQVVIAICCLFWTRETEEALAAEGNAGLHGYATKCDVQKQGLVNCVRGKLSRVERATLQALLVIEVHNQVITNEIRDKGVADCGAFDWQAQLRYYWEDDHLWIRQTNAILPYGYEYLGNTGRLVVTPLTDRCYRTLTGALHLNYGGAPEGPAGTGKTETVKDLSKALAKHCVVYNCSDQCDYKMMGALFKGLAQAGSWACLDEFNRIEIQVLSVIAQQISTIQMAIAEGKVGGEFVFEGVSIRLKPGSCVFITMNPGYAGRAELPDNLKALFRPVAMMVPDYRLIGEISLFSCGFLEASKLSTKIVTTYKLCSESLSSQSHYDYGMRAVKSVLNAAARLKQAYPEEDEAILILRSIKDVNLPKFLTQDVPLFSNILGDLFPGVVLPKPEYEAYTNAMHLACAHYNVQCTEYFSIKAFECYEMINVRHGLMTVGYSFGSKSTILKVLAHSNTTLHSQGLPASKPEAKTHLHALNPKSVTMGQLYGQFDMSGDWNDGILARTFRTLAEQTTPDRKWIVLDGPVDAIWIENMNTVLDDNKKLCLVNGDIISMADTMNMIFEVQDLLVASPATVSRCGMIYVEPETMGWNCLFESWMNTLPEGLAGNEDVKAAMVSMVHSYVEPALYFASHYCKRYVPSSDSALLVQILKLWKTSFAVFEEDENTGKKPWVTFEDAEVLARMEGWFVFAVVWAIGGSLDLKGRLKFDKFFKELLGIDEEGGKKKKKDKKAKEDEGQPAGEPGQGQKEKYKFNVAIPDKRTLFDFVFTDEGLKFADWLETLDDFSISPEAQYHNIIVPTTDTARYSWLLKTCILNTLQILFVGETGTGKTILIKDMLTRKVDKEIYLNLIIGFSAQTSANQVQDIIDSRVDKRRKGVYGPPIRKKLNIFIDDLNMPQKEEYGAQPPIEIIRQWMDYRGWYEHKKDNVDFRELQDVLFIAAMGPPGGGRSEVTPRLVRHFNVVSLPPFDDATMKKIFGTLADWIVTRPGFPALLASLVPQLVQASVDVYNTICEKLLPTPEKSHYTFNLRDISKVFQGICLATPKRLADGTQLAKIWIHECSRVFHDRLTEDTDRAWFKDLVGANLKTHFKQDWDTVVTTAPLIYADFMENNVDDRLYEELADLEKARRVLQDYLSTHNHTAKKQMDLVIFTYVLEHVSRISRVIKLPFGHCLLIGVGGSGRQSCTRLAAHIAEYKCLQPQVTKGFSRTDWLDNLRAFLRSAGMKGESTVYLLTDTQIVEEEFLEDICNILNTGEVPSLMQPEDLDHINEALRQSAKEHGCESHSKEVVYNFFVERCKVLCHIVMAFSPVGSTLRSRLRKFPSLVNCSTIDWFTEWPKDGLHTVAATFFEEVQLKADEKKAIVECCVKMQRDTQEMCKQYLEEARMHSYVTPTSYLELLSTFRSLLANMRASISSAKHRYDHGLDTLKRTEEEVEDKQQALELLKPHLVATMAETAEAEADIAKRKDEAAEIRSVVALEEEETSKKEAEARGIEEHCKNELAEALPALNKAMEAVKNIDKGQLTLVKSMGQPPEGIKMIMSAVCVLLGEIVKAKKDASGKMQNELDLYWDVCKKKVLADLTKFQQTLIGFADKIEREEEKGLEQRIDIIQKNYLKKKEFNDLKVVEKLSGALVGIVQWVTASELFFRVNKKVKPMKAELARAQGDLAQAQSDLKEKRTALKGVDDRLAALQADLDEKIRKGQELKEQYEDTSAKLERALKLVKGLAGEKVRYLEESERLGGQYANLLGNVIISAGQIAYLGPFTSTYRNQLIAQWTKMCKEKRIQGPEKFSLEEFLGDPLKVQQWKMASLPADSFSVDTAVMMHNTSRWPLFIDPQMQANNWIRNKERDNRLTCIRPESDRGYLKTLEVAIRSGTPVLMENIGEVIDPVLEPLLLKQLFRDGANWCVLLNDAGIEYNDKFRLYITTKLPRPHYKPEVSTKVSVLAFMITPAGLTDQVLSKVVSFEEKELDDKKRKAVEQSAKCKQTLKEIEDDILLKLTSAATPDELLASEDIIVTLDYSQKTSEDIKNKMQDIRLVEQRFEKAQQAFVPVAIPASALFFCIDQLSNIDPMYQYSLQFYLDLFHKSLVGSKEMEPTPETANMTRAERINEHFSFSLYKNVCRSLFAKDRLLLSFTMSFRLHDVDAAHLRFFMTGGLDDSKNIPETPSFLPLTVWKMVYRVQLQVAGALSDLCGSFKRDAALWQAIYNSPSPQDILLPLDQQMEGKADGHSPLTLPPEFELISDLFKLIILRAIRPDKIVPAVTQYVVNDQKLGTKYTDPPIFNLEEIFRESPDPWTPLIFVLSPGADPNSDLNMLADKEGKLNMFKKLSLGQGQDRLAKEAIYKAKGEGSWVLLQNCHLYSDWMPEMQRIIETYSDENVRDDPKVLNPGFRLWLTSMPAAGFPAAVLQNGVKMVLEPPKGLRSNLLKSYTSDPISNPKFFSGCKKPREWKKLLFGLCFFHSAIQERRAFGPLGWNIPYEFNDTDLRISIRQLQMFLNESAEVPVEALNYLAAECNYGGRVTDDRDRRCLKFILADFFCDEIFTTDGYKFSPSGVYYAPDDGPYDTYLDLIRGYPQAQLPEVFGLHDNADITREEFETSRLLDAVLLTLPRQSTGGSGSDPKQVVLLIAKDVNDRVPPEFDLEKLVLKYPTDYNQSMNTVLFQECVRFNRLVSVVHSTLSVLQKAIRGEVVMSSDLESVFNAIFDNKIPPVWMKKSYPSLKPFGGYVDDLIKRLNFLQSWFDDGAPAIYWLPGFFFPQAFLTGVMQNHARRQKLEIDKLDWDFETLKTDEKDGTYEVPESGTYVYGLYMQGAGFDRQASVVIESKPKEQFQAFPTVFLKPCIAAEAPWLTDPDATYMCPVYRTTDRRGILMTTGHSTNFIMPWYIPVSPFHPPQHWVKRGTALFCSLPF
ncbi:Dynein-1-beta heavy chain [Diplonema papillatum]|nr:Dynein-1-beta heavy chain [Diplonema papillatum]